MVIIGGAAIALEYKTRHLTRDLDTSTAIQGALHDAVERARRAILEPQRQREQRGRGRREVGRRRRLGQLVNSWL